MGYTHYWERFTLEFRIDKWQDFIRDFRKVLANLPAEFKGDGWSEGDATEPIVLGDFEGTENSKPEITDDTIAFNGIGDLSHESFILDRKFDFSKGSEWKKDEWKKDKRIFDFCKTARKPYSYAVEMALLLAKYHFHDNFDFSSDGDDNDWKFAKDEFAKLFPRYAVMLNI